MQSPSCLNCVNAIPTEPPFMLDTHKAGDIHCTSNTCSRTHSVIFFPLSLTFLVTCLRHSEIGSLDNLRQGPPVLDVLPVVLLSPEYAISFGDWVGGGGLWGPCEVTSGRPHPACLAVAGGSGAGPRKTGGTMGNGNRKGKRTMGGSTHVRSGFPVNPAWGFICCWQLKRVTLVGLQSRLGVAVWVWCLFFCGWSTTEGPLWQTTPPTPTPIKNHRELFS